MKKYYRFSLLLISCMVFSTSLCLAKALNLYDLPKADAKVIGSIDSDKGIIPIYTPKEGGWIKVGDPNNGNVGWLKQSELKAVTGLTFMQHILTSGTGPQSFEIMQSTSTPQITSEQTQAITKRIQENQQAVQKAMQKMMQDMFNNTTQPFPVMVPVIIVPQDKTTKK